MTSTANETRRAQPVDSVMRARLRDLLEDQRRALLRRAAEFVDDIDDLQTITATHGQGETEHVNSDVEVGLTIALGAKARAGLEEITLALARMDDGSYGDCMECGAPIGAERLLAVPQARYCVACQQRLERGGRI